MSEKNLGSYLFNKKGELVLTMGGVDKFLMQGDGENIVRAVATKLVSRDAEMEEKKNFLLDLVADLSKRLNRVMALTPEEAERLLNTAQERQFRIVKICPKVPNKQELQEIKEQFSVVCKFLSLINSFLHEVDKWDKRASRNILSQMEKSFPDFIENAKKLEERLKQFGVAEIERNFSVQVRGFNFSKTSLQLPNFSDFSQAKEGFGEALQKAVVAFFRKGSCLLQQGISDTGCGRSGIWSVDFKKDLPNSFKIALGIMPASENTTPVQEDLPQPETAEFASMVKAVFEFLNQSNGFVANSSKSSRYLNSESRQKSLAQLVSGMGAFKDNLDNLENLTQELTKQGQNIPNQATLGLMNSLGGVYLKYVGDFTQLQKDGICSTVMRRTIQMINEAVQNNKQLRSALIDSSTWTRWVQTTSQYVEAPELHRIKSSVESRHPSRLHVERRPFDHSAHRRALQHEISLGKLSTRTPEQVRSDTRLGKNTARYGTAPSQETPSSKNHIKLADLLAAECGIQRDIDALGRIPSSPSRFPQSLTDDSSCDQESEQNKIDKLQKLFYSTVFPVLQESSALVVLTSNSDKFIENVINLNISEFVINIQTLRKATLNHLQVLYKSYKHMLPTSIQPNENFCIEIVKLVYKRLQTAQAKCSGSNVEFQRNKLINYIHTLEKAFPDLKQTDSSVTEFSASPEKVSGPRDPEKFLGDVFDWIETNHYGYNSRDRWGWRMFNAQVMTYIDMLYSESDIPSQFVDQGGFSKEGSEFEKRGRGIDDLIKELKKSGKQVFSKIVNKEWFLEIVEPQEEASSVAEPETVPEKEFEVLDKSMDGLALFYDAFWEDILQMETNLEERNFTPFSENLRNFKQKITFFPQFMNGLKELTLADMQKFSASMKELGLREEEYDDCKGFIKIELPEIRERLSLIYDQIKIHDSNRQILETLSGFIASISPCKQQS